MTDPVLETIEIAAPEPVELAVIWLHGLGADGHDFAPVARQLDLSCAVRFVFPHAPYRPVTINGGMRMRAWFDLLSLERDGPVDEAGVRASAGQVSDLIERELARGLRSDQVVLAGFSQGGAIALHTALRYSQPLAGVLALSTYLPLPETLASERNPANASVPIWLGHGTYDPVIGIPLALASKDQLVAAGCRVEWHTYAMAHAVSDEELSDIGAWFRRVIPACAEPD